MDKFTKRLLRSLMVYLVVWTVIMVLFSTVLMLSTVPTGSMESTINVGDFVFGTRYGIGGQDIKRYDIIVFALPDDPEIPYIKRVIGLPGETIVVSNGSVYADGIKLDDSFIKAPMNRKGDGTYVVPEGCYFVLGDNRNQSKDSRFWKEKYVPVENIKGIARFIVFPFKNIRTL